jgi:hypothetical protein
VPEQFGVSFFNAQEADSLYQEVGNYFTAAALEKEQLLPPTTDRQQEECEDDNDEPNGDD